MLKIVYFPHRLVLQTRPILMFFLTPLRRALGSATCDAACIASDDRRRRQCCGRAVGPADVTAEGISESLLNESGFLKIIPPKSFKKKTSFVLWKASPTCPRALEHHKSLVAPKDPSHQKWTIVLSWSLLQLSRGWFLHIEPGKWQRILPHESQSKEAHKNAKRNMQMLAQPDSCKSWHTYPNFCSQLQVTPRKISMQQTSSCISKTRTLLQQ
jgi:hypothetical protein